MSDSNRPDTEGQRQLEVIELLDERFRLREDPVRRSDLEETHGRLRNLLRDTLGRWHEHDPSFDCE